MVFVVWKKHQVHKSLWRMDSQQHGWILLERCCEEIAYCLRCGIAHSVNNLPTCLAGKKEKKKKLCNAAVVDTRSVLPSHRRDLSISSSTSSMKLRHI